MNISNPATGAQKLLEVEDDRKLRAFMDKRISQEVDAGCLGDEWKVSPFLSIYYQNYQHIHFKYIFAFK